MTDLIYAVFLYTSSQQLDRAVESLGAPDLALHLLPVVSKGVVRI